MKIPLISPILACISLCCLAADATKSTDQASLQGVWLAQTESLNGHTKQVTFVYTFRDDKLTFKDENGKEVQYSFKLDTASKPKLLMLQPVEAPANAAPVGVAYELEGDSLKIVVAPSGSRPTDISDKNDQELIICKRKGP
ncbi:MAG: TIGR03067 domain-containing protein [Verrucomicrobia bacterium]|nr:TIGR03067 domain-containing protein [Verrucomicrobiota bacterium]